MDRSLDCDAICHAIWPELTDEIHQFTIGWGASYDSIGDAEPDAIQWLIDGIEGNARSAGEAMDMVLDLMGDEPESVDAATAFRLADEAYAVLATVPDALRLGLIARLILDRSDPAQVLSELTERVVLELGECRP
jgi:hypothetical protein